MVITINYGDKKLKLNLPDQVHLDEFDHDPVEGTVDFGAFETALVSNGAEPFDIREADLFIVNDAYRQTPTAKVLGWLDRMGLLNRKARFLIATGSHQAPTPEQLEAIFGAVLPEIEENIHVHNAEDIGSMNQIGWDEDGNRVRLNRIILDADNVVIIGSVEPHYFAGFTGGRKSIFPGLCDLETIVRNHNRAVSFEAMPMRLNGNPIEEDLRKLMKLYPCDRVLSIQMVLASETEIQAIFIGRLQETFNSACDVARRLYGKHITGGYDLLLAEARPPLDANLYQLQKSLENTQAAVVDGGTVILFSPCHEGIGSKDFYRLADSWTPSENDMPEGRESFGRHKLYRVFKIGQRINVHLYSDLPEGTADKVYFNSLSDPQGLIDGIIENKKNIRAALVHDSGQTVLAN
ncbi:MAG: lactate racemase domain-containing protein [Candidatus Zixiibacteriota bacterium]